MSSVAITSKGQMTLPKSVREDLDVKPGDRLELVKTPDGYLLTRKKSALELFARLPKYGGPPLSVDEMDQAIEEEVWERNRPK